MMNKILERRFLIAGTAITLLAVIGLSSTAEAGTAQVSCQSQVCNELTFGLGPGYVEGLCRAQLQPRCDSVSSQACSPAGVSIRYLTNENIQTSIVIDNTCADLLAYKSTGTARCNWECKPPPPPCEFTSLVTCEGFCCGTCVRSGNFCYNCDSFGCNKDICGQGFGELRVVPVSGDLRLAEIAILESASTHLLERREQRDGFDYVMEDWSIVAVNVDSEGLPTELEVLSASSTAYGDFEEEVLTNAIGETHASSEATGPVWGGIEFGEGRSILLTVRASAHFHNSRWIPTPVARFEPTQLPGPRQEHRAEHQNSRVVVRADYGEDRTLIDFEVLYAERQLSRLEEEFLETNLRLEYASEKQHRAVVFAMFSVGKRIILERAETILPMCCCGGEFCA